MLIVNAGLCEALPLFLDRLVGPILAVVVSVTGLVLFREIVPHAYAAKHGLRIGSLCRFVVWTLVGLLSPVCYPIAALLDCTIVRRLFYRWSSLSM